MRNRIYDDDATINQVTTENQREEVLQLVICYLWYHLLHRPNKLLEGVGDVRMARRRGLRRHRFSLQNQETGCRQEGIGELFIGELFIPVRLPPLVLCVC